MAVCPKCKAELGDPSRPCSNCGPSPLGKNVEISDVPDLAVPMAPAPRTRSSASLRAVTPPPAPSSGHGGGDAFDSDDVFSTGGGEGAALELDVAPTSVTSRAVSPVQSSSAVFDRGRMAEAPPPTVEPPSVDPFDARALADYGDPPTKLWQRPLYAFRVLSRRAELKRLLAVARDEAKRAELKSEDALVSLGERARAVMERTPGQGRGLEEVLAAEALLRSRDGALAGEMDATRARLASIDTRIQALEGDLLIAQAEEKRIADELAQVAAVSARADAKMKRAEIEIRNATALLESKRDPLSGVRKG